MPGKTLELRLLLQGGLGNQLLQVVLAESLANSFGKKLYASCALMDSRTRKARGLTCRSISPLVLDRLDISQAPWHRDLAPRLAVRMGIPWMAAVFTDGLLIKAAEEGLGLDQLSWVRTIHSHATHPLIFEGQFNNSWQSILRSLDAYKPNTSITVAMHVRRGDYMDPRSGFVLLDAAYYKAALGKALDASATSQAPTLVHTFSDDPEWCLNHLRDPRWLLKISYGTPEQDLACMAHAKVLITGNSSFSAVAGHLAELRDPSTLVFTPERWLRKPNEGRLGQLRKPRWQIITL